MKYTLLLAIVSTLAYSGDDTNTSSSNGKYAIEIGGTKLTLSDFEQRRPTALFQARNNFYEAEKKALEEFAEGYLLEQKAQKEGLTVAQLLDRHVNSTTAQEPDETALRVYYEGIETAETFEEARPKILQHIRDRRIARAKKAYIQSLRDEAKIAILLTPPRAPLSLTDTPVRGTVGAPVTLVEFADYECPYCQQIESDLARLETEFKGQIVIGYKDLPLPMHAHAQKASEAAQCAGVQKKYWEFHDEIFRTKQLDIANLKATARQIGLDAKVFDECLDSGQRAKALEATLEEAQRLGLQGTPSFFLNGRFFSGIMKYEQLRQMVVDELKKSSPSEQRSDRQ